MMTMRNWKRYAIVFNARRNGATLKEAGKLVGVTPERARQMEFWAIREISMAAHFDQYRPLTEREGKILLRYEPYNKAITSVPPSSLFMQETG